MPGKVTIYKPSPGTALRQTEILSGLAEYRTGAVMAEGSSVQLSGFTHPFAIALSQDCDLEQDYKARNTPEAVSKPEEKKLSSILFCEMVTAEQFKGNLADSQRWKRIRQNKDERYQYLRAAEKSCDAAGKGFPDLAIDFKRYFTIPTEQVYVQVLHFAVRRAYLVSPYLEQLASRFAYFLSRVALPEEHFVNVSPPGQS